MKCLYKHSFSIRYLELRPHSFKPNIEMNRTGVFTNNKR